VQACVEEYSQYVATFRPFNGDVRVTMDTIQETSVQGMRLDRIGGNARVTPDVG